MRRLEADFHMLDEQGRFWLPGAVSAAASRGEHVLLTDGELEIAATLDYDDVRQIWVGTPDEAPSGATGTLLGSS